MSTVIVSEKALRELVREALDGGHLGDMTVPPNDPEPVNVNPVVDPSAAQTDPTNPNFMPQSRQEFDVAVRALVRDLPVDKVPAVFTAIQDAVVGVDAEMEDEAMDKKAEQGGTVQVEEAIRREVRKIISEITPKADYGFSGTEYGDSGEDDEDDDAEGKPKRAYKSTALGGMGDVDYDETKGEHEPFSFEQIAKELGFSVAGAKQAVDKSIEKLRFLHQMDDDDREIIVLTAMNDYIKELSKSGELTPADVQLMKDHPEVVRTLDGFREFLHNTIRKARKGAELENPLGEDD